MTDIHVVFVFTL